MKALLARGSQLVCEIWAVRFTLWIALGAWFLAAWLGKPYQLADAHDGSYFLNHAEGVWRTYVLHREFPVWDPYFCGGIPAVGNVQNNAASPFFVFPVLFGIHPGLRLMWLAFFVTGMEGAFRFARHHGVFGFGALAAAVCFGLSGRFVQIFDSGQPVFLGFHLMPWVLLGFEKGVRSNAWAVGGGVAMALVFLEGGAVATPLLALVLAFLLVLYTLGLALWRPPDARWYRPTIALAIMALVTVGLTAFRLFPVAETLLTRPRVWHGTDAYSARHLYGMLFEASNEGGYAGRGTSYVGTLAALAFAYALVRFDSRAWLLVIAMLPIVDFGMGTHGLGLYKWVRKLPVLENIRESFRMTFPLALYAAAGAGRGLWLLEREALGLLERDGFRSLVTRLRVPPRVATAVAAGLVLAGSGLAAWSVASEPARFNKAWMDVLPQVPAPRDVSDHHDFQQSMGNRWHAQTWPVANLGSIGCFEEQPFPTSSALRGDLAADEYLTSPRQGTVQRTQWSPHRIELAVDLATEATVVVNQNEHRGWHVEPGRIVSHQGLVAARVPKGKYQLTFWFADPLVDAGWGVTWATLLGLVAVPVARWLRRRKALRSPGPPQADLQ